MRPTGKMPQERGYLLFLIIVMLFAVATYFFAPLLALIEALCAVALYFMLRAMQSLHARALVDYMRSRDRDIDSATRGTIVNAALPMVIFQPDTDEIIWTSERFLEITGKATHLFDTKLSEAVPDFASRWLQEGKTCAPEPVTLGEDQYLVFGNLIDGKLAICYWVAITQYAQIAEDYERSRPVTTVIMIDNYEDLMRGVGEGERSALQSQLHKCISKWAQPTNGVLCRYDREHYLLIFEQSHLAELRRARFSLLEATRQIHSANGIAATLSIGMTKEAGSYQEMFAHATASVEMALSRGGDQVVLRDGAEYQFFGGKAKETERRTKLKSRVVANAMAELLGGASCLVIMGHSFPDLDVSGAAAALASIARSMKLPFYIVRGDAFSPAEPMFARLAALPEYENAFLTDEQIIDRVDEHSLLIVVDTNRPEQVQSAPLLEAVSRVMIIDHHRRAATYIESPILSFEDPYSSSASELCAELMQHLLEPGAILRQEAEAVLAGIVLDTKNFSLRTGSRTFEAAAYLRRAGADTAEVRKLFQTDLEGAMARYNIVRRTQRYRNELGIAVTEEICDRVTAAKAADEMISISDISASFVLCPTAADTFILSARSIGDINVQLISERLGGGGNAAAAGAQLRGLSATEAATRLREAIDAYYEND